jgi:hypothetical protein
MTMEQLQRIIWFFLPVLGLIVLVVALGARGGVWMVFPMAFLGAIVMVFYILYLRARSH